MSKEEGCVMVPRMLIATRFGIGIRDPAWFDHRLVVMSAITVPSLLAQHDQEFEWGVFAPPDIPSKARQALDEILAPFGTRAFIDSNGHVPKNLMDIALARDLVHPSGYVLTGRIDDDDAWARDTVKRVRSYTQKWFERQPDAAGFGLTFENGLVWVMYDMLDVDRLQTQGDNSIRRASLRPYSCAFTSISGFVCSPYSVGLTPIGGSHRDVPKHLKDKGFEVDVVPTTEPMWLYCRHKQADSALERVARGEDIRVDICALNQAFGIDETRVRHYIARSHEYGYSTTKRIFERRGAIRTAIRSADMRLADCGGSAPQRVMLEDNAARLRNEHATLGENLIAAPTDQIGAKSFRHVIQTRFSIQAKWGFQEFPVDWLETRLQLFDSYCLPSIASQTCGDFIWQVYCDSSTDVAILEELQRRTEGVPQMRIAFTGAEGSTVAAHALELIRPSDLALITTRLDSDDAISVHYVQATQAHIHRFLESGDASLLLNFPRGVQLNTANNRLLLDWMPRSSFHTLFERVDSDVKTVVYGNHSTFHEQHPTLHDDSILAWLMVIHGGNVLNKAREYYTGEAELSRLAEFGISIDQLFSRST